MVPNVLSKRVRTNSSEKNVWSALMLPPNVDVSFIIRLEWVWGEVRDQTFSICSYLARGSEVDGSYGFFLQLYY